MPTITETTDAQEVLQTTDVRVQVPDVAHGGEMWRIARDSGTLDLNSSYAYLLFCRDFPRTCRIATVEDQVAGFVLGNLRPERPDCVFVWQIAVDERFRGKQVGGRLLDGLVDDLTRSDTPVRSMETTITEDNSASQRLFLKFAERWGDAPVRKRPLFTAEHFPDGHEAEPLYEIGPLQRVA